jgi:hypothetical protein
MSATIKQRAKHDTQLTAPHYRDASTPFHALSCTASTESTRSSRQPNSIRQSSQWPVQHRRTGTPSQHASSSRSCVTDRLQHAE